ACVDRQPVQPRRELRLSPELADPCAELRERFLGGIACIFAVAQQMERELLDTGCVTLAERLECSRVPVFCPFDQNRIAQPSVDQCPFRPEGLFDWTAATTRQLHPAA